MSQKMASPPAEGSKKVFALEREGNFGANEWQGWIGRKASVVVETVEAKHFIMVAPPDFHKLMKKSSD